MSPNPDVLSALGSLYKNSITIIRPSLDDVLVRGQQFDIKWQKAGRMNQYVSIGLFGRSGRLVQVIAESKPNSGTYHWTVPRVRPGRYTVGITTIDGKVHDFSEIFQIRRPRTRMLTMGTGDNFSVAVKKRDKSVWTWGSRIIGTGQPNFIPVRVEGLPAIVGIDCHFRSALALDTNGEVWLIDDPSPSKVPGLSGVEKINSERESLALKSDGTVWRIGSPPTQVEGLEGVTDIAQGGTQSFALKDDGTLWAWGYNEYGQLGDGSLINRDIPTQVQNLSGVIDMDGGTWHSLALTNDGTVWSWGVDFMGELGRAFAPNLIIPTPGPILGLPLSPIRAIAAGAQQSFAITEDNSLWAWGNNADGQLGNGMYGAEYSPILSQTQIRAVSPGYRHTLFLKTDETLWASGFNQAGQLGDGTNITRYAPIPVEMV